jgi:hypothetical protein
LPGCCTTAARAAVFISHTGSRGRWESAERSAALAEQAGCSSRTVQLIRYQDQPVDDAGRLLHEADEAN